MTYAETHAALVDAARLWVRTTCFADVAPQLRKATKDGRTVYRTDSVDTKTADALLDLWLAAGTWTTIAGKKTLGKLAGVSPNTAQAALRRLAPWFVVIEDTGEHGMRLTAGDTLVSMSLTPTYTDMLIGVKLIETENGYSPRKAHDAYQSGTSRKTIERAKVAIAQATHIFTNINQSRRARGADPLSMHDATPRAVIEAKTLPGMGETGLRILDALTRCGEMTVDELATETGKSASSIRNYMPRLYAAGAVAWTRETPRAPKVWEVIPGAFSTVEAQTPAMRTWGMQDGREAQRLEQAQQWAELQHRRATTDEERAAALKRRERATMRRAECLMRLHPEWDRSTAKGYAADVPFKQWVQRRAVAAEVSRTSAARAAEFEQARAQVPTLKEQLTQFAPGEQLRVLRLADHDPATIDTLLAAA